MPPNNDSVSLRHAEIAKLMAEVDARRQKLMLHVINDQLDDFDASRRNQRMPGSLGEAWQAFISLEKGEKVKALRYHDFHGHKWQSLLQCSPYFFK